MSSVASGVTQTVAKPFQSLGISDLSTSSGIGGALLGAATAATNPAVALAGGLTGRESGQRIEDARAQADADEASRQQFNDEIFALAESLQGRVAQQPFSDFERLNFSGEDPRQQRLQNLINIFANRSQEVIQRQFEPGISQTRLSLVE